MARPNGRIVSGMFAGVAFIVTALAAWASYRAAHSALGMVGGLLTAIAAAMIVMFIFTYCVLKVLLGYHLGPYETRTIGKIVVIALATIFFGGFFILLFRFIGKLIWNRKPESNIDRGKRGDRARGSQSHSSN